MNFPTPKISNITFATQTNDISNDISIIMASAAAMNDMASMIMIESTKQHFDEVIRVCDSDSQPRFSLFQKCAFLSLSEYSVSNKNAGCQWTLRTHSLC